MDVSVVNKKLRRTIGSEGKRQGNQSVRNKSMGLAGDLSQTIDPASSTKLALKSKFDKATKNKTNMSPKVLETWINETL